jgi:hypothetical protein
MVFLLGTLGKCHKAPKALALSARPIEGSKKSRDFFEDEDGQEGL